MFALQLLIIMAARYN